MDADYYKANKARFEPKELPAKLVTGYKTRARKADIELLRSSGNTIAGKETRNVESLK